MDPAFAWGTETQSPMATANSMIIKACFFIFCLLSDAVSFFRFVFIFMPAFLALDPHVKQLPCQSSQGEADMVLTI
jgi:hypothetical protein